MTKIKQHPLKVVLVGILAIQLLLIAFCNLTLIDKNIDCDNAKLFVHTMNMWREKSLLIPGWSYTTTLELDCSSILALPLYGILGNIYLAYGIANILFVLILIAVLFYMFEGEKAEYPLLTANLVCIPYSLGMLAYFNMMFFCGSQYIMKILIPLLFVGVLLQMDGRRGEHKKRLIVMSVIYIGLVLLTSVSSGVYVTFTGLIPVIAAYALYKLFKYERVHPLFYVLVALTGLCLIAGVMVNNAVMGGARGNSSMVLVNVYQALANVSSCIFGIFELFGGIAYDMTLPILSLQGIAIVARACFTILFAVCGIIAARRVIKGQADLRMILLVAIGVWNLFVLLMTNTRAGSSTYEFRYHLIGMIPIMCVTAILLLEGLGKWNRVQQTVLVAGGAMMILVVTALSFRTVIRHEDEQVELKEVCEYLQDMPLEYVYMYDGSNDADMCRLISGDEEITYLCVVPDGLTYAYDYHSKYELGPIQSENAIMVVDNAVYDFGDQYDAFGYTFTRFAVVGNRSLYHFE